MKILKIASILLLSIATLSIAMTRAGNLEKSSQNEIFDNPFIVTGFDPDTKIITGYVAALRTAPERTDECKFVFSGRNDGKNSLPVLIKNAVRTSDNETIDSTEVTKGQLTYEAKQKKLIVSQAALPGDCDWIVEFVSGEKTIKNGKELSVLIDDGTPGDWLGVYATRSKRTYIHKKPEESSAGKAYLIAGDLVYMYEEKKDWYYIKDKGRKVTSGWIKKTDTIQFRE